MEARLPRPRPDYHPPVVTQTVSAVVTPAAMKAVMPGARFADGAYTGPVVDAYYGLVQIQAVVQSGQLADVRILRYPSDRMTSVFINRRAIPRLRREAISAQSASIDLVSGATLTSEAFVRSLDVALRKAHS